MGNIRVIQGRRGASRQAIILPLGLQRVLITLSAQCFFAVFVHLRVECFFPPDIEVIFSCWSTAAVGEKTGIGANKRSLGVSNKVVCCQSIAGTPRCKVFLFWLERRVAKYFLVGCHVISIGWDTYTYLLASSFVDRTLAGAG